MLRTFAVSQISGFL